MISRKVNPEKSAPAEEATQDPSTGEATVSAEGGATAPEEAEATGVTLEGDRLRRCLEAVLFASPDPLPRRQLRRVLREAKPKDLDEAILELEADLISTERGFRLVEDASGLRLLSGAEFAPYVARLRGEKRRIRLSPASFETLAVVAYRQPIGRADLDAIRGVQSGAVIKRLHEWNLVHIVGRDDNKIGRPMLYGTSKLFLEQFGLSSLDDLPEPERFLELGAEQGVEVEEEVSAEVTIGSEVDGQPPAE